MRHGLDTDDPGTSGAERFETLCLWQQALRVLRRRGRAKEAAAREDLLAMSEALIDPWTARHDGRPDFSPESLAGDLRRLRDLDGAVGRADTVASDPAREVLHHLVERMRVMGGWQESLHRGTPLARIPRDIRPRPRPPPSPPRSRCACCSTSRSISPRASATPIPAAELLERVDQLLFALRAGGNRLRSPGREALAAMLADVPRPTDHAELAAMDRSRLADLRRQAEESPARADAASDPRRLAPGGARDRGLASRGRAPTWPVEPESP